ncbi:MAG: ferredoxin [Clostridiaceae bacterium]|jgi:ferredoxin|nr:ferredoxin [Clostridiaceae bacterium]
MKAHIDRDGCIGCGLCEEICPEVFHIADDGLAEVIVDEVLEDVENEALEAADSCPTQVITVE